MEVTEKIALWREYLRELHGVDIVRYEWQPAGEQIILKLLLGDRHLASDRTAEQLMAKAKDLSADMRVTLEASCYAIDLAFRANTPALGYTTYEVEACDSPSNTSSPLSIGERVIENEYLQVEVEQDGSMSVRHKATGQEYRGLNQFEDAGDTGDTYDFCPLPSTDGSTMLCCKPEVTLIEDGPLQAALRIQWEFEIPGELTADRKARSARRVVSRSPALSGCASARPTSRSLRALRTRQAITGCGSTFLPASRVSSFMLVVTWPLCRDPRRHLLAMAGRNRHRACSTITAGSRLTTIRVGWPS